MFSSANTQQFGKIAILLFDDLSKSNDFIFMKRSKTFSCDKTIPQFLVIIFGKSTETANCILITLRKNAITENLKKLIYTKVIENLKKISGNTIINLKLENCEHFIFSQETFPNNSLQSSKYNNLLLCIENNKKYLIPKEFQFGSLRTAIVSTLISCNNDEIIKNHPGKGLNLLDVKIHGSLLKDLQDLSSNSEIESKIYKFPELKLYNSLKFWKISRRKDCGLFLLRRSASTKAINQYEYKEQIANSLDEITSSTRFLINDEIAFEDVCKIRKDVHEVISETHNGVMTWLRSSNSTDLLQEFSFNAYINENENIDCSVKILHGLPGSGKSSYLKRIEKESQDEDFARWINFLDGSNLEQILQIYPDLFNKSCTEILYKMFNIENEYEKACFKYCSGILGRVICFIDNFDDLPKSVFHKFAQFLRTVKDNYSNILFCVTARSPLKDIIIKYVPIFPYNLPDFDKEQQKGFLKKLMPNYDSDGINEIVSKIGYSNAFNKTSFDVSSKFDTTPYNLWLCSEKIKKQSENTSLYYLDVYDFYIEEKMQKAEESNLGELSRSAAFHFIETTPNVDIKIQRSNLYETVFGKYQDRTILEYLTARFLFNNPNCLTENIIFKTEMNAIMDLFDRISFRGTDLGVAVLNGNLEKVLQLSEIIDPRSIHDIHGRNLAHVVHDEHSGILEHLLDKGVSLHQEDSILKWTPVRYAAHKKHFTKLEIMLKNNDHIEYLRKYPQFNNNNADLLFEEQFHRGNYKLCELILNSHDNFVVTPLLVNCVTRDADNYPKKLVIKILKMAKEQKLNEKPAYFDRNGESAIHNVVRHIDGIDIMKILIEDLNYDVNCKEDETGTMPIFNVKSAEMLDYLIQKGADPYFEDSECNYRTLFHNACMDGNLEIVKYYVEVLRTDPNKFEKCIHTPLYSASFSNNIELVKFLWEHGFTKSESVFGETALHNACLYGNFEIVKYLVEHGENVNCISRENHKPIDKVNTTEDVSKSKIYNYLIEKGSTFTMEHLYYLLKSSNFENFKKAIEKFPVDWNYYNQYGYTLLHYCAQYSTDKSIIRWIGERSDLEYLSQYERGTPLHLAYSIGNEGAVEVLLELGADLNARTESGETMMHFAVRTPNEKLLNILFEHGLDINAKDNNGLCPVHVFAQGGDGSLAKLLIDHGMNVNSLNSDGLTALSEVCKNNYYYARNCVEICLRDLNVDPNIRDNNGRIALHYAVENDNIQIVMVLEKYTILDLEAVDQDGETPFSLAKKIKNSIVYTYLCECKEKQCNLD